MNNISNLSRPGEPFPMDEFVKTQTNALRDLWYACSADEACFPAAIPMQKKLVNEERLAETLRWLTAQLEIPRSTQSEKEAFSSEAKSRFIAAAGIILDLSAEELEFFNQLGKDSTMIEFFHRARAFDPSISMDGIFQAVRNMWIANTGQVLLGVPVALSPALFAYSMLYPVSDNYLDDPALTAKDKIEFNQRFRRWLEGSGSQPRNQREEQVVRLIRMIEAQYPRDRFSQVYASLLAIHTAQDKSMRTPPLPHKLYSIDLLGLSFEKGGTSTLADGVLSAGKLTREQAAVIFNLGGFLQLVDDLEDMESDLKAGSATIFTEARRAGQAEQILRCMFSFSKVVFKGLDDLGDEGSSAMRSMARKNIGQYLINAVMQKDKSFSGKFLGKLEKSYLFRRKFIKKVTEKLKKRKVTPERLIGIFPAPDLKEFPG